MIFFVSFCCAFGIIGTIAQLLPEISQFLQFVSFCILNQDYTAPGLFEFIRQTVSGRQII